MYDFTAKPVVRDEGLLIPAFSVTLTGDERTITSNGNPTHLTGHFPIATEDPAFEYDPNPNEIVWYDLEITLPATPEELGSPDCLPQGPIGIMMTGTVLFSALDAAFADAGAHEIQDVNQGHPDGADIYHYHTLSAALQETDSKSGHSSLMGYAFDGYGIYGYYGEDGKLLTNSDLDECHGHTHAISWDGARTELYHYHATPEYPYTLGCYKAEPERPTIILGP
jgi:hypothetical protein